MIFGNISTENVVQINDKTRLDATRSFLSKDEAEITLIEIQPSAGDLFIDVTSDKYLDWAYSADETNVVTLRITTDGAPATFTSTIDSLTIVGDYLYSNDQDLLPIEGDIMKWLRSGRNSWLDKHREAQTKIVSWLDEHNYRDTNGARLTKVALTDKNEVKDWSKYYTLMLIFRELQNSVDDVYADKALTYEKQMVGARNRSILTIDVNGDGIKDGVANLRTSMLVRR